MRHKAINWIFLACLATALTSELEQRPRRHLHEIKQMIANKLFVRKEPNCTQPQPNPPGTRFFRIPGFNEVVIKAVPKGSVTPPPLIEKIPPNSHLGIVGSYLGTNTVDETYNALLGAKNLFKSGILEAKHGIKLTVPKPTTQKPVTPCPSPGPVIPPVEPIGIVVKPAVPEVVPTRYSYKQVNQDGSVTTWSSYLDFNKGVKVTEDGKTLPFIIDRIRKVPVHFPVPVLPEVSKILIPYDGNYERYPVIQPASPYSYQQMHRDGRLTTYTGLPSFNKYDGPVAVTETGNVPPPPFLFENAPLNPSFSQVPADIIGPRPMSFDVPAEHAFYEAPVFESPLPVSGPGYSYTQIHGGKTTSHQASGAFRPPLSVFPSIPENNPFGPPIPYSTPYSYNHEHSDVRVTKYGGTRGSSVQEQGEEFSGSEPLAFGVKPLGRNPFSYRQTADGKVTFYNGAEMYNHPSPAHVISRTENVTAGIKFNRIKDSTAPLVDRFAYPVPNDFVKVPSVQSSVPQRPVKPPSASGTSPFMYKFVHRDGSVTSYGGDGSTDETGLSYHKPASAPPTPQQNTRVFESPIYPDPFPIDVNTNAFKPSSPVSGSYSYKLLNNGQVDYHYDIGRNEESQNPGSVYNEPFPVPPMLPVAPALVQGCVDPDSHSYPNSMDGQSTHFNQEGFPEGYSYTQTGYNQPKPYFASNAENPAMSARNQGHYYPNTFDNDNVNYYPDPKDYVYIPPARYDEIPPPIKPLNLPRLPPKKFSNRFLYEMFDGYNFKDENPNLHPSTPKPQESSNNNVYGEESFEQVPYNHRSILSNRNSVTNNLVEVPEEVSIRNKPDDDVDVENAPVQISLNSLPTLSNRNPEFNYPTSAPEKVSVPNNPVNSFHDEQIPSSPQPIPSHQSSLTSSPITVQENTSFLFKQSNPDGSSITTTHDGGIMSVQVEEASKPQAVHNEESLENEEETRILVDNVPSTVPVEVEESVRTEPTTSTMLPRRRKIKRVKVKHRGDIPDNE